MIYLSDAAAQEIKRLQLSRQQPKSYFRLSIKTGGCAGLFYTLELKDQPERGDRLYDHNGISVIVDNSSDPNLEGLKLDYSEDLMGGGFRFHNPNASVTCSCGQSFSLTTK